MKKNTIIIDGSQMRNELEISLFCIADPNWREDAYWPDGKTKQSYGDYIEQSFLLTIYDRLDLDELDKAKNHVGSVLFTEEEAKKLHEFTLFFDEAADIVYDDDAKDEEIENAPLWPQVRKRAQELYDYLKENDKKYNIEESWKLDGN